MTKSDTILYPLDPWWAEVIFAPFHDPELSSGLDISLKPVSAPVCEIEYMWCYTNLLWEGGVNGEAAVAFEMKADMDMGSYNTLLFSLAMPKEVAVRFELLLAGKWIKPESEYAGTNQRMEIVIPVGPGKLSKIRALFLSGITGVSRRQVVNLSWFGMQNSGLINRMLKNRSQYNAEWIGLIKPMQEWQDICFERGLVFDSDQLPYLRMKAGLSGWKKHFGLLEAKAEEYLDRIPEEDIFGVLPTNNVSYIRGRETGKTMYCWEALILGFVGLVKNNRTMMHHALRYLMSMVHTPSWACSAEHRLPGSTWDMRCFHEAMAVTSVSLLADWFSYALTDHAKGLICQSIWDKGLAIVERDMMKFEYLYACNQGVWFCNPRILGGLILEKAWPRMGGYVDRAYGDMAEILKKFIRKDGGTPEGIGYFGQMMQAAVPAAIAYARVRGCDPKGFLAEHVLPFEEYLLAMSGVRPGTAMTDGDCRTEYFCGDVIPIMAAYFPGSSHDRILQAALEAGSVFAVTGGLTGSGGIYGFIHGPDTVKESECTVPAFLLLSKAGCLSSFRKAGKHSLRIHLTGSSALPSHSHLNRGAFTMEMDGEKLLVDRGMLPYSHPHTDILKRTYMHNCITPVLEKGRFANQNLPGEPVIPQGKGDDYTLEAAIDIAPAWRKYMAACTRSILSTTVNEIVIEDSGELLTEGRIAFHLHSAYPFSIESGRIVLKCHDAEVEVQAEWVEEAEAYEDLVDFKFEPVYHLCLVSGPVKKFRLKTALVRFQQL